MALHYHIAVAPSSSFTFLLALPRLWSTSSLSLLSPLSLHSSASGPQATEQDDVAVLQLVPVMDLPVHWHCLTRCEHRQPRSLLSSPTCLTEPLFCGSVLYPDTSFTKLLAYYYLQDIYLPVRQVSNWLGIWWIGREIAQGTTHKEIGVRKPTKLSKEKRQLELQHSRFSLGLL